MTTSPSPVEPTAIGAFLTRAGPLGAFPRTAPFVAGFPRVDEERGGGDTAPLTLDAEAAVGLLNRSAVSPLTALFVGVLGAGALFRALARDAAVGANRPAEGVLGRDPVAVAVSGRADGVLDRAGVFGVDADFLAAAAGDDVPVC